MKEGVSYPSVTKRMETSCGHFYVTTVHCMDTSSIIGVLFSAGKAGGCASAHLTSQQNHLMKLKNKDERLEAFTEMTSIRCHLPECCVREVGLYLLKLETKGGTSSGRKKKH